jgi:membrane protein
MIIGRIKIDFNISWDIENCIMIKTILAHLGKWLHKHPFFIYPYKAIQRFINDKYSYRASALTYATLLAIVPLFLTIFSIVSAFPMFDDMMHIAEEYLFSNLIPSSASAMEQYMQGFIMQATKLSAMNILFLIMTAFLLINTIEETFNEIWQVKIPWSWHNSAVNFLFMFVTPFLISLSILLLSSFFTLLQWLGMNNPYVAHFGSFLIPFLVNIILFGLIFIIVPHAYVPYRAGILGGVLAAFLLELTRRLFTYYIGKFSSYSLIYGGFAIIPIFLIWLYLFWCIILFSAEITYVYSLKIKSRVAS